MVSPNRIASIIDNGEMLPVFGIVPWKHHILIASKSSSIEEAFYYLQRTIDEGISLVDKLPSVQELQERIRLLELQLEERGKEDTK